MTTKKPPLGVVLINLGTPDTPDAPGIRRYLKEFLADPRVVNVPRLVWLPILYCFILTFRPRKLVEKYASIWRPAGAPIRAFTQTLADRLHERLNSAYLGRAFRVAPAMTYGNPSIESVVREFQADGINDFLFLPLFPQYAGATIGAVSDKLGQVLSRLTVVPGIRFIDNYHDDPVYVHALTRSIEPHVSALDDASLLVFSFHGIPVAQSEAGDPYRSQCEHTAGLVATRLGLTDTQWKVTFQSRFGPAPWLQPYTDETMESLPEKGIKKVFVVCPGFSADCLETLEEIDMENREIFMEAGGESFTYIPALNDSDDHLGVIEHLVKSHLYDTESALV
ncbi:MAG: ferrochelatase [Pseudomonadales bacterium]|nr:ferrochelatase [Pseudomonadales bacterium]